MAKESNKEVFMDGLRKLLKEEWQADICLKGGDSSDECSSISAHKLVLASKSEVFKKMLEPDDVKTPSKKKVEIVTLSEMKQEELEALVEFLYSDGSLLSEKGKKHVRSLYVAADKYVILHLRDLCRSEMISTLSPENALDFLELAQIPFDEVLNDAAFDYIKTNVRTISSSENFREFIVSNPNLAFEIMKASLMGNGKCSRCQHLKSYCRYCGCNT
ncbi:unnamed protein product [Cochlearia groenlandica]